MKSIATRFLLPFGLLSLLFSIFVLDQVYEANRRHAQELLSEQAAVAVEYNLAIRDYAAEKIRPVMQEMMGKDDFIPEVMSTSFISRSIYEKVHQRYTNCIIRFASDNPRNPVNQATADELQMIEYFCKHPGQERKTAEIRIDGKPYLAHFTPKRVTQECLQCHGNPEDAPAALVQRYGWTASFHRKVGDVAALDMVAVPIEGLTATLAETRHKAVFLASGLILLLVSVVALFHFLVSRRLTAMAMHCQAIAEQTESAHLVPMKVRGKDEIGTLGLAFNRLVEQLRATQATLESRVSRRTSELAEKNTELQREIAQRQQTEQALRLSEQRLHQSLALFERAQAVGHIGSWISEAKERKTLHWSRETRRIFGSEHTEFDGRIETFHQLIHPEDRAVVEAAAEAAWSEGAAYDIEHRILLPGGVVRWVHEQAEVERDASGQPLRMVGVVQDITERRVLEDQLRQSQKLDSIGQLAAGVAHDFNNILTVISVSGSLLRGQLGDNSQSQELLQSILTATDRAAALTRQLLLFSRKQRLQPQPLNLNEVTSNLTKMLGRMLGEDIKLEFSYYNALPLVNADPGMMEQVMMNLAVNARDAMPRGGMLQISTSAVEITSEDAARNPEAAPGRYVCLAVRDTGCGIPPEIQTRIFEPFFSTKEVGKGTGLGLATVYGIVKQHNGWIELESAVGQGTTFRIYLPVVRQTLAAKPLSEEPPAVSGQGETILLVEDEAPVRRLVEKTLQQHGYEVVLASSGPEALDLPREQVDRAQLLLTDMVMPGGMSGRELADELVRINPRLAVVYCSGYTPEISGASLELKEGVNFLPKPFSLKQVLATVHLNLESRRAAAN